jgi:hypothetical protein
MHRVLMSMLALLATTAWAGDCKVKRQFEETLDLSGARELKILAAAGDLVIEGKPGLQAANIRATVCASSEEMAEAAGLDLEAGADARVAVILPDSEGGSWFGNKFAWMDLEIDVPDDLALDVRDSSGDLEIENVAALTLKDSSGDIEVSNVAGLLTITDSSGDIDIEDTEGDVVIEVDSSGNMRGSNIAGSVLVKVDSSGDIRFDDVRGNVIVERDSSGSIEVAAVGGDFRVLSDGSGDILHRDVAGELEIPEKH